MLTRGKAHRRLRDGVAADALTALLGSAPRVPLTQSTSTIRKEYQ
jgi:hypothetical protein